MASLETAAQELHVWVSRQYGYAPACYLCANETELKWAKGESWLFCSPTFILEYEVA